MLTPETITLAGIFTGLGAAFGAGRIVESIRNGRFVRKDSCKLIHAAQERADADFRAEVRETLKHIRDWMEDHA